MFKHISWSNYLTTTAIIASIYYLAIIVRFFLPEIKQILTSNTKTKWFRLLPSNAGKYNQSHDKSTTAASSALTPEDMDQPATDDFDKIRHVCDQLSLTIDQCANESAAKGDFSLKLSSILQQYPPIKHSPYYDSINELIVSECGKHHYNLLTDDEVKTLWSN